METTANKVIYDTQAEYNEFLPDAYSNLLHEFLLHDLTTCELTPGGATIQSQLGAEPYNMIRRRDGTVSQSKYWKVTLQKLWQLATKNKDYVDQLKVTSAKTGLKISYSRSKLMSVGFFQQELLRQIKRDLHHMGYHSVYLEDKQKYGDTICTILKVRV